MGKITLKKRNSRPGMRIRSLLQYIEPPHIYPATYISHSRDRTKPGKKLITSAPLFFAPSDFRNVFANLALFFAKFPLAWRDFVNFSQAG